MQMNREEIQRLIPHRDPFLWLDEVVEISGDIIRARKFLDPSLDVFSGHYPNQPVFPGVLQCEAAMQAGAVLISHSITMSAGQIPVATRLNNTKFRRIIHPGEMMDIEVELTERLSNAFFLTGKVSVAGKVATRLEFACAAVESSGT